MTAPVSASYSPFEERINVRLHIVATGLALVAGLGMALRGVAAGASLKQIVAGGLFSLTSALLYAASSSYHAATEPARRHRLKVFDHCAIYLLIAGTYTPFTLVAMAGSRLGSVLFALVWGLALAGVVFKLFYTGRFVIVSTLIYIAMGWLVAFDYRAATALIPPFSFDWLLAGGVAYTVGAVVYLLKRVPYTHAIWHVFIMLGNACHFVAAWPLVTQPR